MLLVARKAHDFSAAVLGLASTLSLFLWKLRQNVSTHLLRCILYFYFQII